MTDKATDSLLPLQLDSKKTSTAVGNDHKDFVFEKVLFDTDALFSLQSIFDSAESVGTKTASIKFMITIQDEIELQNLGYSKEQIDKLKPLEAEDILKSGMRADEIGR
jgi:hypothetical protein